MSKAEFQINSRKIGFNHEPLIIAEIGINHNGSLKIAKQMVKSAVKAGAEVVKHQTHIVADEMSSLAKKVIPGNSTKSIYDIMNSCALDEDDELELMKFTQDLGAIFISTPFSRAAADRLARFDIPAYKIGSGECNNYPLIRHIAKFGKPIILSTGMNTIESVQLSVNILEEFKIPYALLHTTNLYPTPPELVRLNAMLDLQTAFPNAVIGLSDHTTNNLASFGAIALGASIIERHYTDSMKRKGPDIVCSMDPKQLKELKWGASVLKKERGGSKSESLNEEQVTRDFAYATVVSIKNIKKGEKLTEENIWVKRPGVGEIKAIDFERLLGKEATEDIEFDTHLNWSQFK